LLKRLPKLIVGGVIALALFHYNIIPTPTPISQSRVTYSPEIRLELAPDVPGEPLDITPIFPEERSSEEVKRPRPFIQR
jgi:hypothetical protein